MNDLDLNQPAPQFEGISAEAQALIDQLWSLVAAQAKRIEQLENRDAANSRTSSRPPSSDDAKARAERRGKTRSGRAKGGQVGHKGHYRARVEAVDEFKRYEPPSHCSCGGEIELDEDPIHQHQVFDLPRVRAQVTEHQVYAGVCCRCGRRHRGQLPEAVAGGQMGAGLRADIALMNSHYRLSLRQLQRYLHSRWDLHFSLGALSAAQQPVSEWLAAPYEQIGAWLRQQPQLHADETVHYHHSSRFWLWTMCSAKAAYFRIHPGRGKRAARELLGDYQGVLNTDRYAAYNDYSNRQLCWAHVIRNLEQIARRQGMAGVLGKRLVRLARLVIRVVHHRQRGYLSASAYQRRLQRLRQTLRQQLQQGSAYAHLPKTQHQCQALLQQEALLWTFLNDPSIPLTNNLAEQALRSYVIWRKTSFFTQSVRGMRFRERILSVTDTAERLGLNTFELLRQICCEGIRGDPITVRLPLPEVKTA
ncbi:MAG: IS66 family transposase [Candidatus Competibacteraceae bacterium]|nr:IS66 family transposase [Candidatus Competibacteraceae bacterium]